MILISGENVVDRVNLMSLLDWKIKWIPCFSLDVRRKRVFQIQLLQLSISFIDWIS